MMKRLSLCLAAALLAAACTKESVQPEVIPAPVHVLQAGFMESDPDTRSRLELGESVANVLWTAGDSFKMIQMTGTGYRSATYTTEDDGVDKASFTTNKTLDGADFTSAYPASACRVGRRGEMGCYLITPIPSQQKAVAGGLEEGLNRAAAWSDRQDADLHFHNLLSFIRFRVDGASVSSLSSVTFEAGTTVAGDATVWFEDGIPHIDFSKKWNTVTVERSTSITLNGPFAEGQDYCIALAPTYLKDGFTMTFRDEPGNELVMESSKSLLLSRSRMVDFGTIHLGDSWDIEEPAEVIEYVHQRKGNRKNVIAVCADGFKWGELFRFEKLAKDAVDYLFSVEPYKSYKDYFTVYIFRSCSNESGAGVTDGDHNVIKPVDNCFGSRWGSSSYSDMEADPDKIRRYLQANCPEIVSGELNYKEVPTVLIINDDRYGGICHVYSNGWCYAQVPYTYSGGPIQWSFPKYQAVNIRDDSEGCRETTDEERDEMGRHVGDWRNVFLHEFGGHGYGRLADEYWSSTTKYTEPGYVNGHFYSVPYALNVSGFYNDVPWQEDLLDHLDEWRARNSDYDRISVLHGGQTSLYYRWRSEMVSCMIDNRPYYSAWQRILLVRHILEKAGVVFSMEEFIAKDVTTDPIRPAGNTSSEARRQMAARAALVPEMPMLPPPVLHEEN